MGQFAAAQGWVCLLMWVFLRAAFGGAGRSVVLVLGLGLGVSSAGTAVALDVARDMGGSVAARLDAIHQLERSRTRVRITGTCVSACTLYLGLSRTCVMPGAKLGFHGPTSALPGIPLPPDEFERVSRVMAAHYPPALRAWYLAEARKLTGAYVTISGRDAIRMGARPCP
jgi:hypothetical protein